MIKTVQMSTVFSLLILFLSKLFEAIQASLAVTFMSIHIYPRFL